MSSTNLKDTLQSFAIETLGLGPKSLVGVDIGTSSIKVCELLHGKKGFKVQNFSYIPLPEGAFHEDDIQKYDEIVQCLQLAVGQISSSSKFAAVGVWGPGVISKRIQVPVGSMEEIEDQVLWESEQYIPFDIDQTSIDFHVIGENKGGGADVLIAAAKHNVIEKFKGLVEETGLTVKIVDLSQYALANAFIHVHKSELDGAKASVILIDFGSQTTNIVVFRQSEIVFTRELNVGGHALSEEIQRSMGLSYEEAEDLKRGADPEGNLPEEIVDIIDSNMSTFLIEIKKTLNFYMTATGEDTFQRCYITGGTSQVPGLLESLENEFGVEVLHFNPFEKIAFDDKKIDEETAIQIATIGATAIGLAMRSLSNDD